MPRGAAEYVFINILYQIKILVSFLRILLISSEKEILCGQGKLKQDMNIADSIFLFTSNDYISGPYEEVGVGVGEWGMGDALPVRMHPLAGQNT